MNYDGVFPIERRVVLKCAASALWSVKHAVSAVAASPGGNGTRSNSPLSWNQFVDRIAYLSELRSRKSLASNGFVDKAASSAQRLNPVDKTLVGAFGIIQAQQASLHTPSLMAHVHRQVTFELVLLVLDAGYSIALHDHPHGCGISVCKQGKATVAKYDLAGSETDLSLRLRSRSIIRPTETGTLTDHAGDIHTISAVPSTQIVDVFSPPRSAGFHWYKTKPDSADPSTLRVTSVS